MSPTSRMAELDYQKALSLVVDEEVVREMLVLMDDSLKVDLPQLSQDLSAQAWAEVAKGLHRLKGVLPMFCDEETAQQLSTLEQQSKTIAIASEASQAALAQAQLQAGLVDLFARLDQFHASVKSWLSANA
jgi:HPt (histidine-containing phosphotransfer) domain-containing protein